MWIERLMAGISHQHVLSYNPRTIKYHLALTDNGYSLIINSLNNLRNDLIAQGRYTDAVDDVLVEFIGAKKKNFKIIYQEG